MKVKLISGYNMTIQNKFPLHSFVTIECNHWKDNLEDAPAPEWAIGCDAVVIAHHAYEDGRMGLAISNPNTKEMEEIWIGEDELVLSAKQRALPWWEDPKELAMVGRQMIEKMAKKFYDQMTAPEYLENMIKELEEDGVDPDRIDQMVEQHKALIADHDFQKQGEYET